MDIIRILLINIEGRVWNGGFVFLSSPIFTKQTRRSDKQALPNSLHKGQTNLPGILEHLSEYTRRQTACTKADNFPPGTLLRAPGDRLKRAD